MADVQEAVYGLPALAERVCGFALLLGEDESANKKLDLAFELHAGADAPADVRAEVLRRLEAVNQDWREASRFMPPSQPTISFHPEGTGPFAGGDPRVKHAYVRGKGRDTNGDPARP